MYRGSLDIETHRNPGSSVVLQDDQYIRSQDFLSGPSRTACESRGGSVKAISMC